MRDKARREINFCVRLKNKKLINDGARITRARVILWRTFFYRNYNRAFSGSLEPNFDNRSPLANLYASAICLFFLLKYRAVKAHRQTLWAINEKKKQFPLEFLEITKNYSRKIQIGSIVRKFNSDRTPLRNTPAYAYTVGGISFDRESWHATHSEIAAGAPRELRG